MENMLSIFDKMKYLRQYEFDIDEHKEKMTETIRHLCVREGLLPPCESTYTVHELLHVVEQIPMLGPPMMSSMFKSEQKNKSFQQLIKNQRFPISSIVKNYLISEALNLKIYRKMKMFLRNHRLKGKIS
jgi:hypothetical protein